MTTYAKYRRYMKLGESLGTFIQRVQRMPANLHRPKSPPKEKYWQWRNQPGQY